MGLNCSHGAFDGAYSAFNRFRSSVAAACGGSHPPHSEEWCKKHPHLSDQELWYCDDDEVPKAYRSGMTALLSHSDCDGCLTVEQATKVAIFLRWVAPKMTDETVGHLEKYGPKMGDVALNFAKGCELAVAERELLEFG